MKTKCNPKIRKTTPLEKEFYKNCLEISPISSYIDGKNIYLTTPIPNDKFQFKSVINISTKKSNAIIYRIYDNEGKGNIQEKEFLYRHTINNDEIVNFKGEKFPLDLSEKKLIVIVIVYYNDVNINPESEPFKTLFGKLDDFMNTYNPTGLLPIPCEEILPTLTNIEGILDPKDACGGILG